MYVYSHTLKSFITCANNKKIVKVSFVEYTEILKVFFTS